MPDPAARAWIAHRLPGRVRLRFAGKRGDAAFLTACADEIRTLPGVRSVETGATACSLLILHEGPFEPIGLEAVSRGLFVLGDEQPEPSADVAALAAAVPPMLAAAGGLGALALLQLSRGAILPPAITLLWYAASLARRARPPAEDAADDGGD
jgi:hypothetical protein